MSGAVGIWPGDRPPAGDYGGPLIASWWGRPDEREGLVALPNPWDDPAAVTAAEERVWAACEELVALLAQALGGHDEHWWRWVAMPWLVHVTSAVEDARLYLERAVAAAPGVPVVAAPPDPAPPATMAAGIEQLRSSEHHRALVARIAHELGLPARPPEAGDEGPPPPAADPPAAPTPGVAAGLARLLLEGGGSDVAVLGHSGMTGRQALALRRRTRARILPARPWPAPAGGSSREPLAGAGREGADLVAVMSRLLPALTPVSIAEGRDGLPDAARAAYGRPSNVVVGNYGADEAMNAHIAACATAGHRVDHAQHGGFYLQAEVNAQERLEVHEGSAFLAWRDVPSPHLEHIRDTHAGGDAVVVVEGLNPPDNVVLRFASTPLADQAYESTAMLAAFATGVGDAVPMTLRPFPREGAVRPPALERLGQAPGAGAVDAMRAARLAVLAYPDTPFVEAMVLGVPAIGLWNPEHWRLREDALPAFQALADAGVVFAAPEDAAQQVTAVYNDADAWWASAEVTAAREEFIARFAPRGDWLAAWTSHLRGMRAG